MVPRAHRLYRGRMACRVRIVGTVRMARMDREAIMACRARSARWVCSVSAALTLFASVWPVWYFRRARSVPSEFLCPGFALFHLLR